MKALLRQLCGYAAMALYIGLISWFCAAFVAVAWLAGAFVLGRWDDLPFTWSATGRFLVVGLGAWLGMWFFDSLSDAPSDDTDEGCACSDRNKKPRKKSRGGK